MIRRHSVVQSLYEYGHNHIGTWKQAQNADDGQIVLPPIGWTRANVPLAIVISFDGTALGIEPLGNIVKKKRVNPLVVPIYGGLRNHTVAYPFADKATYILGIPKLPYRETDPAKASDKAQKQALLKFKAEAKLALDILKNANDDIARAAKAYFAKPAQAVSLYKKAVTDSTSKNLWKLLKTATITLAVKGHKGTIIDDPEIRSAWDKAFPAVSGINKGPVMNSMITGQPCHVVLVHPAIKAPVIGRATGMALISFGDPASYSHGLVKGMNAPMSYEQAFAYTSALNALFASSHNRMFMGNRAIIWWSDEQKNADNLIAAIFNPYAKNIWTEEAFHSAIAALAQGKPYSIDGLSFDPDNTIHLLILSGHSARLVVRGFWTNSLGSLAKNVENHYLDMAVPDSDKPLTPVRIVRACLPENDDISMGNNLVAPLVRSIVTGEPYPAAVFYQTLVQERLDFTVQRTAIIRGCLVRNLTRSTGEEARKEAMENIRKMPSYTIGRIVATSQRIQEKASSNTSVSNLAGEVVQSPASMLGRVFELANLYLNKLPQPARIYFEKILGECATTLSQNLDKALAYSLTPEEEAAYWLGYNAQYQKFFEKKAEKDNK